MIGADAGEHVLRARRIARHGMAIVTSGWAPTEALGFAQSHDYAAQNEFDRTSALTSGQAVLSSVTSQK